MYIQTWESTFLFPSIPPSVVSVLLHFFTEQYILDIPPYHYLVKLTHLFPFTYSNLYSQSLEMDTRVVSSLWILEKNASVDNVTSSFCRGNCQIPRIWELDQRRNVFANVIILTIALDRGGPFYTIHQRMEGIFFLKRSIIEGDFFFNRWEKL
jgi:hypothetical protein